MAIQLATIALFAFFSFVTISLTFLWRVVESILTVLVSFFESLLTAKGIVIVTVLAIVYGAGFGVTQVQELSMQWIDYAYECGIEPVAEFAFSASVTLIRGTYEFFVINGWNAGVTFIFDIVGDFISTIKELGVPNTVAWYIGFWDKSYEFIRSLGLFWLNVPGWQIPFGVTDFFNAWVELFVCFMFDIGHTMLIQVMGLTFFCNHCRICDIDPMATCLMREQLIPTYPPAIPMDCMDCHTADCTIIRCVFAFTDLVTEVIQQTVGVDFTPVLDDLADATCCIQTNLYLPPVFLAAGFLENIYLGGCSMASFANIPTFVIDKWLFPLAQCFIDFAFIASGGIIDNIFIDIFAVFFPFIQDVVTTFQTSALCFGTDDFVDCIEDYPFTCSFAGLNPIPTGGLFTCFEIYGDCVINGVMGEIDPAPLYQAGNFPDLFLVVIPSVFKFSIDLTICNFVSFVDCVTPGQPGYDACVPGTIDIDNFIDVSECIANCVEANVPLFSPIAGIISSILDVLGEALDGLFDGVELVCDIIDAIPGISCNLLKQEGSGREFHAQMKWTESLEFYNVSSDTFCGNLLWSLPDVEISMNQWGDYIAVYMCLNLYGYGITQFSRNSNESSAFRMDDFLSPISFAAKFPEFANSHFQGHNSSFTNNLRPEKRIRFDKGRHAELKTEKMKTRDTTLPMKEFKKMLSGFRSVIQERPYAHLMAGYIQDMKSIQYAIDVLEGRIKIEIEIEPKRNNSGPENADTAIEAAIPANTGGILQEYNIDINQIDIFNPGFAWKRANQLHTLYTVRDELNLRFASAMNDEFQRRRTLMPWYAKQDAGRYGRDYYEKKSGKPNIWKNFIDKHNDTAIADASSVALRMEYENQIAKYKPGYKIYTKEELQKRQELLISNFNKVGRVLTSGKGIVDVLNHDDGLAGRAFKYFDVEHWAVYQNLHMTLTVLSEKNVANFTKKLNGEVSYLAEEGFVTHGKYHQIMEEQAKKTDRPLFKFMTGNYSPREKKKYGPFLTNPDAELLPDFKKVMAMHGETYEKARLKRIEFLGLTPDMPEAQGINLVFFGDPVTDFIFDTIEFFINDMFGSLFHLLTGQSINLDLQGTVEKIFNFFSGITIDTGTVAKAGNIAKDFATCVLPEDIDGTNVFNPFCFPHLPENALAWLRPVPNQFAPLQVPWPSEFIDTDCVNTFNGNPNLFFFRLSDNCGSMDGQPRPLCPTCDYCQRTYSSCLNIPGTVNYPLDTFFFITGIIPIGLDQYFTGGIRTDTLMQLALILGTFYLLTTAPITVLGPQIVGTFFTFFGVEFIIYSMDKLFGFYFSGEGGGLPFAVIYIAILLFLAFFLSEVFMISAELTIFLIFIAVLWVISLVFPFPSFNEQFNINWFLESFFTGLNYGPTPLKLIDWTGFIDRAQHFNFHTNSIPAVDIACFFWTFGNISLLVAAGYVAFWFIYWLWLVVLALIIYAFAFFGLIFATISAVRQWMRTEELRVVGERLDDVTEVQKKFKEKMSHMKQESIPQFLKKNKWYKPPPALITSMFGKEEEEETMVTETETETEMETTDFMIETDSDVVTDTIGFSIRPVIQRNHQKPRTNE